MALRVAILCEYPTLNGGERSMLACIDRLVGEDVRFTFLAPGCGPLAAELQRRDVRHVPFDVRADGEKLPRRAVIDRLVNLCAEGFDLLHANSLAMGRLSGAAATRLSIPCTAHLRDILKLSPAATGDLNGNAKLVAVSQAVRDFHVAQGLAAGRVNVIYNGIDAAVFCPRARTGGLRCELGLPRSALLIAAIGQICLRKGQDVFADAAVRIAGAVPQAHFLLIGARHSAKAESVEFEAAIEERFAAAGLAGRYHALGERDDIPELLNEIDMLIHAARQEPFGRVLLEAAAAGVPIVATDVGGTSEMLTDGLHAVLVGAGDPQAIAEAALRLADEGELAARMGRAARKHVVERFPIEHASRAMLAFWKQAVAAGPC